MIAEKMFIIRSLRDFVERIQKASESGNYGELAYIDDLTYVSLLDDLDRLEKIGNT